MEANGTTSTCQPSSSNIALQTEKGLQNMPHNDPSMIVSEEHNPMSNSINKLIKSISDSGISISMQSK